MAARQAEIRGRNTLTDTLLTPRPVTRLLMLCLCVLMAGAAWHYLPVKLLSYLSGVSGPFCLLCATAIWSLRDKANDALSGDDLPVAKFQSYRDAARAVRVRVSLKAAYVALCSLLAFSPAISNQLAGPIWHWMVIAGGMGVAEATYGYMIANAWEEELIDLKDRHRLAAKVDAQRQALMDRLAGPHQVA